MQAQDLLLVQHLSEPRTLTQLARDTGRDASRLSRVVRELEALHLVRLERKGRHLRVSRGGLAANVLEQLLEEVPHQGWGELLTQANLELFAFFSSPADPSFAGRIPRGGADLGARPYVPKTLADAAAWTGYTRDHVRRLVDALTRRAILRRSEEGFILAPELPRLAEFARLFHEEWAWAQLAAIAKDARPAWQLGRTILFTTRKPLAGGSPGGVTLAGHHGVPLIVDHHTYLKAPWSPTPSDAILQTYLENPTGTTNVVAACILYAKHRPKDLLERGRQYGVPGAAALIQEYAENPGSHVGGPFPPAKEYREMARDYGVE